MLPLPELKHGSLSMFGISARIGIRYDLVPFLVVRGIGDPPLHVVWLERGFKLPKELVYITYSPDRDVDVSLAGMAMLGPREQLRPGRRTCCLDVG